VATGRSPDAARVRGYEPRPQAPHPPPFPKRPAGTPLGGEGYRNIIRIKNIVNEGKTHLVRFNLLAILRKRNATIFYERLSSASKP
jgi:hypothetical protein